MRSRPNSAASYRPRPSVVARGGPDANFDFVTLGAGFVPICLEDGVGDVFRGSAPTLARTGRGWQSGGMRAITLTQFGGPEVLTVGDVERPTLKPAEVLINAPPPEVNRADLLQRQGHYPPPKGTSEIIGLEVSGHIEEIGEDVTGWSVGDPCVALLAGGGYADYVAVDAGQVIPPPPGVDLITAAGLLEVAATVVSNMDHVRLADGETFLVHGGAGGIGSFAIQYAKSRGCTVAATAGTEEKLEVCRELGTDIAIDYHDDWPTHLREATEGHGADVILDVMGAKYLDANVTSLARLGRLVVIGLSRRHQGRTEPQQAALQGRHRDSDLAALPADGREGGDLRARPG